MEVRSPNRIYKDQQPMVFATVMFFGVALIFLYATIVEALVLALLDAPSIDSPNLSFSMAFFSGVYLFLFGLNVVKPHLLFIWCLWRLGKHWGVPLFWGLISAAAVGESDSVKTFREGVIFAAAAWWPAYGFITLLLHQLRNPPARESRPSVRRRPIEDDDEEFFFT